MRKRRPLKWTPDWRMVGGWRDAYMELFRSHSALAKANVRLSEENRAVSIDNVVLRMALAKYQVEGMIVRGDDPELAGWTARTMICFPDIPVTAEEDEAWEALT